MKHIRTTVLAVLAGALVLGAAAGNRGNQQASGLPALPSNPTLEPIEMLEAVAFVLDEPFAHTWRKDQPSYRAGYLVVLRADPDLIRPRQTAEPVLYAGEQTVERCNAGDVSGCLIGLIPAPLRANGSVDLDIANTAIWFGDPELPERLDAASIRSAYQLALTRGAAPVQLSKRLRKVQMTAASNTIVFARDRDELELAIADLIEMYSPTETDLVAGMRVPITRR